MRTLRHVPGCLLLLALLLAGCSNRGDKHTEKGGGARNNFSLSGPRTATSVEQGNEVAITVTAKVTGDADRADQVIDLAATSVDAAFSDVRTSQKQLKLVGDNSQDFTVTVRAANDAPVGDHVVRVTATPAVGEAALVDVHVKVTARRDNRRSERPGTQLEVVGVIDGAVPAHKLR